MKMLQLVCPFSFPNDVIDHLLFQNFTSRPSSTLNQLNVSKKKSSAPNEPPLRVL